MLVVGLLGAAAAGKSTAAKYLVERHGFMRVRMADTLKNMLRTAGLTEEQIDGSQKEVPCPLLCMKTPRQAMQTLGTEWGRNLIGDDVWVRMTENMVSRTGCPVVIDDIRFPNELAMIRRLQGIAITIRCLSVEPRQDNHPSEGFWRTAETDGMVFNPMTEDFGVLLDTEMTRVYRDRVEADPEFCSKHFGSRYADP